MTISRNLVGGFGAGFNAEAKGALLGCKSSFYRAKPARPQNKNATRDLFDFLRGVFWRFRRGVHGT
jgi:hypothetical protein